MKRAAVLPLLLALASCGTGRGVSVAKSTAVLPPPDPVVVTAPLLPPDGAVILYYADSRCPPSVPTAKLPVKAARDCYATQARLAMIRLLKMAQISPGTKSPCYPYRDPGVYANCLDVAARKLPAVSYGHSGRRIEGLLNGKPWNGCAAGISGDPIFVSLAQPARIWGLHGWEAANEFLWHTMDRADITDGQIVSESTSAALAACGVQ